MKRKDFFEKWIEALESGEYEQTSNQLMKDGKYCCLGVACDIWNKTHVRQVSLEGTVLPNTLKEYLKIGYTGAFISPVDYKGRRRSSLTDLNDSGVGFKPIAKIIRKQLEEGGFDNERW